MLSCTGDTELMWGSEENLWIVSQRKSFCSVAPRAPSQVISLSSKLLYPPNPFSAS